MIVIGIAVDLVFNQVCDDPGRTYSLFRISALCKCAGLDPKIYHDKYGVHYLKTGNGNQVAIGTDKDTGNIMMVDPAGNLYYDTGDQKLGIYMVRPYMAFCHAAMSLLRNMCKALSQHTSDKE